MRIPTLVRRLGWVSFFTDASSEMIYPLLPALLTSMGASPVWLGAMEGIAEATSAIVKWRIGPVVDNASQKKPLVVTGYGIATLIRPLLALASSAWLVVLLRALDRVGKGIRGVPRDALVAQSVAPGHLATAFAFHRMMDNAGSVLGPILAFALMRGFDLPIRVVIGCAIVPGLVAMAVLLFGVKEPVTAAALPPDWKRGSARVGVGPLSPDVKRYLAVLAVFTLGSSADSFLLLRAIDLKLSPAYVPLLWLALSAAKSLSNMPGGWLADRFGRKRILVLAWLFYAVVYAVLPHVTQPLFFAALVVVYGAYYGLAEGSERAILAERVPAEQRGRAFGTMQAITALAVLPANLLFGILYSRNVVLAFTASAACAAVAAVLMILVVNNRPVDAVPVTTA